MRKKQKDAAADSTIEEAVAGASASSGSKPEAAAPSKAASEPSSKKKSGAAAAGRLTPLDIQQVEFRRGFKGYDEREVDEFLDRLTEDFAASLDENQRLRARLEAGLSSVGTSTPADAGAEAQRIVERARAEAAGIIRDAEAEAARKGSSSAAGAPAGRAASDRPAVSEFLTSEREFLKHLASLVQGHVDDVKTMAAKQPRVKPRSDATPKPAAPAAPRPQAVSGAKGHTSDAPRPGAGTQRPTEAQPRRVVEPVSPVEVVVDDAATPGAPAKPAEKRTVPARTASADSSPAPGGASEEEDPSLRELFWGED